METVKVEYIYTTSERKELSRIRKEVSSIMRCVITSYLIAITLIKIGYVLCMSVKKKLAKQKHILVNEKKLGYRVARLKKLIWKQEIV